LRIDASEALAAGPDVRVVVHDGTTTREIDRLLESPALTFKVPGAGSVWLYAGPGAGTAPTNLGNIYLFAESFDAIASGNGDGPFIPQPPNEWSIKDDGGNHVLHAAGISRHAAAIRGVMPTDAEITARLRIGAGGGQNHVGIAARGNSMATDTMDGFVGQLQLDVSRWRIAEYIDGGSPPVDLAGINRAVSRGTWYTLRMRVVGDAITFFVDDQMITSAVKSGSDGTFIGLFAHNCDVDFDDVRVRMAASPEPTATLGAQQRCE
jgi:hypothetical protein